MYTILEKYNVPQKIAGILVFSIPLLKEPIAILSVLFFVTSFFYIKNFKKDYFKWIHFIPAIIWLMYLVGAILSDNQKAAWFDVQVKMSLLVFPFSFLFLHNRINLKEILESFVNGCLVALLICVINGSYNYYISGDFNSFTYTDLTPFIHPSYLSLYLNFALFIVFNRYATINILSTSYIIPLILFSIFIMLLGSKAGIICLALQLCYFSFVFISDFKWKAIIPLATFILLAVGVVFKSKTLNLRFKEFVSAGSNSKEVSESESTSTVRLSIWKISAGLIKDNPLGYGTGDVKDELIKKYKELDLKLAFNRKLNAHNQYLQTTLALGLLGGIFIVFMFIVPLVIAFKNHQYVFFIFLLLIIVNLFFESMLETQAGIVFILFFYSLFNFQNKSLK